MPFFSTVETYFDGHGSATCSFVQIRCLQPESQTRRRGIGVATGLQEVHLDLELEVLSAEVSACFPLAAMLTTTPPYNAPATNDTK